MLNTLDEKLLLLADAGIDNVIVAAFSEEFRMTTPCEFVKGYLMEKIGADTVVGGFDHRFGYNRDGGSEFFPQMEVNTGMNSMKVPEYELDGQSVSSSLIRKFIASADMRSASRYLGYPHFVIARIDGGSLVTVPFMLLPPEGEEPVADT